MFPGLERQKPAKFPFVFNKLSGLGDGADFWQTNGWLKGNCAVLRLRKAKSIAWPPIAF
jgi:hypothetical protein